MFYQAPPFLNASKLLKSQRDTLCNGNQKLDVELARTKRGRHITCAHPDRPVLAGD